MSKKSEKRPVYLPKWDFDLDCYYPKEGGRLYQTPIGDFESVTTLLGKFGDDDKEGLERWKNKVGEKKAKIIMESAGRRGTALHEMAESFLKGEENYLKGHMPANIELFKTMEPTLRSLDEVYGLEQALYSPSLRMAGRADCVARCKDKNLLVDFKNARTPKKKEWIHNYFLQATSYSIMLKELFDFDIDKFVILISNRNATCDIHIDNPRNFIKDPFFKKVYER